MSEQVDIHVGTLSKAVGAHGGFVACSARMKALLVSRGRSFIFSTAPPAPVVAAAIAALQVNEQVRRRTGAGSCGCGGLCPLIGA